MDNLNSLRLSTPPAIFEMRVYIFLEYIMTEKTPLIWNPILRQYLVNAPHRMNRREGTTTCPFCADMTEGRVGAETQVWLHPNDFPPMQPPVGEAYVVIYNRDHQRTFTQLTVDEVYTVTL